MGRTLWGTLYGEHSRQKNYFGENSGNSGKHYMEESSENRVKKEKFRK